jgi:hypothetical protein
MRLEVRVTRLCWAAWLALSGIEISAQPSAQPSAQTAATAAGTAVESAQKDPLDAFFEAIRTDRVDLVRRWIQRGMDVNAFDAKGDPVLLIAVRHGSGKVIAFFLTIQNVRVDISNRMGETPLMIAALLGDLPTARRLVELGAQINREGWTPLHYAATGGHMPMTRWLLEQSAYIDAESPNRTTPLMMAARQGRTNIVELLIEEGADPTARNEAGLAVADYLERSGFLDLARRADVAARAFRKQHDLPVEVREQQ